jgi:hypothetical protein
MPIVISQPVPAQSFKDISRSSAQSEYNRGYTALASAAQSRFAADRASAGREMLGFAELESNNALRNRQMDLQAAEAQMQQQGQIAAIQERAQMENWLLNQAMTMKEQQEFKQQQNAMVELQELHRKGLVNDEEFGLKFHSIKSRVDFLGMKEQITRNKALNEQRQQHASLFQAQMKREEELNRYRGMTMEDRVVFDIDPTQYEQTKKEMMVLSNEQGTPWSVIKQMNPAEFEKGVRERMKQFARGRKGTIQPDGKIEWDESTGGGSSGTAKGKAGTAAPKPFNESAAISLGKAKAELAGHAEGTDEYRAAVKSAVEEEKTKHAASQVPEAERKAGEAKAQTRVETSSADAVSAEIEGLALNPGAKQAAMTMIAMQKKLIADHGPYEGMPKDIQEKMRILARDIAIIMKGAGQEKFTVQGAGGGG